MKRSTLPLYFLIFVLIHFAKAQIVNQVIITGNYQVTTEKLLTIIKSRWQTKLDTNQIREDLNTIESFYFQEGFLEARCQVDFDKSQQSTSILFQIHEGSPYSFDNIAIDGANLLDEDFIFELVDIHKGERFSREKIVITQLRATATGLFDDLEVKMTDIDTDKKIISVLIDVKEKSKHATHIGSGIDTEDGLKTFFEWKNRHLTRRGSGISLFSLAAVDYIHSLYLKRTNFGITLFDQYLFSLPIESNFNLSYNIDKPKYANFGIENYIAETTFAYNLSFQDQLMLRFRIQTDRIFNATFETDKKEITNVVRVDDNRFIGLSYEMDRRDDIVDPSSGFYLNTNFEKAGGFLGGKNTFFKLGITFNAYFNLLRQVVIANKISSSTIESNNPENLPSYLRLFLGGSGSLRGFPERSVGPKNSDGSSQGGSFLSLNNFEIRYYLSYTFNLVAFFDAGNNWIKRDLARIDNLSCSSGIGARLRTKYGFFRLDFGLRLKEIPGKYIGRIHFGFGQSF